MPSFCGIEPFEGAWTKIRGVLVNSGKIRNVWVEVVEAVPFGECEEDRFVVLVVFYVEYPVMVGLSHPVCMAPVAQFSMLDRQAEKSCSGDSWEPVEWSDGIAYVFEDMGDDGEVEGAVGFYLSPYVLAVYIADVELFVGFKRVDIYIGVNEFVGPWIESAANVDDGVVGVGGFVAAHLVEHLISEGFLVAVGVGSDRHGVFGLSEVFAVDFAEVGVSRVYELRNSCFEALGEEDECLALAHAVVGFEP